MMTQATGMFENVPVAPPDPILGLTEIIQNDPRADKINLTVGVYMDERGRTPILEVVKEAERSLLAEAKDKSYRPIEGDADYARLVRGLIFGEGDERVDSGRAVTIHSPGGTGALRIAADYLSRLHGKPTVWHSDPTWPNHVGIFPAAGLPTKTYPYYNPATGGLRFEEMMETLANIGPGHVVLLHGRCHNPTGADPSPEQWEALAELIADRGALPMIDFAYQGFAEGLDEDAAGLRLMASRCREVIVCSSFSKNFGLYNERVGAMTIVTGDARQGEAVLSQLRYAVRVNYSNPPAHGGDIVRRVLGDGELRSRWVREVAGMRERINSMRTLFSQTLKKKAPGRDFGFLSRQRGMFSMTGLSSQQVRALCNDHAVYIVGNGRVNFAGMTPTNMERLCGAIAAVL